MAFGRLLCLIVFSLPLMFASGALGLTATTVADKSPATDTEVSEEKPSEIDLINAKLKEAFPEKKDEGLVDELEKVVKKQKSTAPIKNDAIIFGILAVMLGFVFYTSSIKTGLFGWFYKFIPMLLVCYFLPSLLTFFEIVDHRNSELYYLSLIHI